MLGNGVLNQGMSLSVTLVVRVPRISFLVREDIDVSLHVKIFFLLGINESKRIDGDSFIAGLSPYLQSFVIYFYATFFYYFVLTFL